MPILTNPPKQVVDNDENIRVPGKVTFVPEYDYKQYFYSMGSPREHGSWEKHCTMIAALCDAQQEISKDAKVSLIFANPEALNAFKDHFIEYFFCPPICSIVGILFVSQWSPDIDLMKKILGGTKLKEFKKSLFAQINEEDIARYRQILDEKRSDISIRYASILDIPPQYSADVKKDKRARTMIIKSIEKMIKILEKKRKYNDSAKPPNISFEVAQKTADVWAQDIAEPLGGSEPVLVRGFDSGKRDDPQKSAIQRNNFLNELTAHGIRVISIPVVIDGGNITKAENKDGKKYVIIGSDDIIKTKEIYKSQYGQEKSDDEIKSILAKTFGADDVLILGANQSQPQSLYHIDLAMMPLPGGKILLQKPTMDESKEGFDLAIDAEFNNLIDKLADGSRIKKRLADTYTDTTKVLEGYKKQLIESGFEVIEIPSTLTNLWKGASYTNSLVLKDDHGKTHIIMPSFGDKETENKIEEALRPYDITVHFVRDMMFYMGGSIHCITGPLAYINVRNEFFGENINEPEPKFA